MKRTIDDAISALKAQVQDWTSGAKPSVRVLVYPPEWEAAMLERLREFAHACESAGTPVELVDAGAIMLQLLGERTEDLAQTERQSGAEALLPDLSVVVSRRLTKILNEPMQPPQVCRVVVNTGAVATFVSFSAITNDAFERASAPAVIAFPGEGDDTALNLMHLRADTNYRTPRI